MTLKDTPYIVQQHPIFPSILVTTPHNSVIMIACGLFLVVALSTRETSGSHSLLVPFVQDVILHFGSSHPAFVLYEDDCGIHQRTLDLSMSFICESGSSLVTTIGEMSKYDVLDMIVFPNGNQTPVISRKLWNHLLVSPIVTIIPKETRVIDTKLQLDSNLYLYDSPTSTMFTLWERYSILGRMTITRKIGTWSLAQGLDVPLSNLWHRRSDLMGIKLRCGAVRYNAKLVRVVLDDSGNILERSGYVMEMLGEMERAMNFTAELRVAKDNKIGGLKADNRTWTGMVGMLTRDEIDLATFVTQTLHRSQVIDFSIPFIRKASTLIARRKTAATNFWVYVDPFDPILWAATFGLLCALAVSFLTANAVGRDHFLNDTSDWKSVLYGVVLPCKMFLQLSYDIKPKNNSVNLLFLVSSMVTYVIFVYYACDLTATMVSAPAEQPIRSFRDVVDRHFVVLVRLGTSSHEVFKTAVEGSEMRRVYDSMPVSAFVEKTEQALNRVAAEEGTLWWGGTLNIIGRHKEFVALRMEETTYGHLGFGFGKNSELRELFSYQIHRLDESGVKDTLWKKWTFERSEDFTIPEAKALGYDNTVFVFILLALIAPFSLIILSFEILVNKLMKYY